MLHTSMAIKHIERVQNVRSFGRLFENVRKLVVSEHTSREKTRHIRHLVHYWPSIINLSKM